MLAVGEPRTTARAGGVAERAEVQEAASREALLRLARRFAAEGDPAQLLRAIMAEAVALVGGDDAAVARWDEGLQAVVTLDSLVPPSYPGVLLRPEASASGRAAALRAPVIVNDYQLVYGTSTPAGRGGAHACLVVPLLHERRLLGTLCVNSTVPGHRFTPQDGETLEVLAGLAAAALVGVERARLHGALLAARTAEHELNNRLALAVGYAELLAGSPLLPASLRPMAEEALEGARAAAEMVKQLQSIQRLEESDWGPNLSPTINLARSLTQA